MEMDIEKRTLRRITWRIVPFIMLLYLIAYIDRVNIGFRTHHERRLRLYSLGSRFWCRNFLLGYFLFEVPSNIILHKVGARIWIARVMVTWGLIAAGMAFVESSTSFYVMRFYSALPRLASFPALFCT